MDVESAGSFAEVLSLQSNEAAADARLRVTFEEVEVEDGKASEKEGRPIFRTKHIGSIYVPGDKDNVVTFDAEKMDSDQRRRFWKRYQEWKETRTNRVDGTLLRECGGLMSRARAREYESLNVLTVEQLADLSDANLRNMPRADGERQRAKDFLATAKGQAPLTQARAENQKLQQQVTALSEKVEKLTKLLEKRTEPTPKRGR
jgi:hypothetical protein